MTELTSVNPSLCLLGEFSLVVGDRNVALGASGRRVLAYLALSGKPVTRSRVARSLWPQRSDGRARANLRSAIWRMPTEGRGMILEDGAFLSLHTGTAIDVEDVVAQCHALLESTSQLDRHAARRVQQALLAGLLPEWEDEWILVERERLRQLHLHALEAVAARLIAAGNVAEAVHASAAALAAEPLRESAARLLVSAHLAVENTAEARKVYERYRTDLHRELGIEPSARLRELMCTRAAMTF
jgi:DNA-binding SARP family transcriptional activator